MAKRTRVVVTDTNVLINLSLGVAWGLGVIVLNELPERRDTLLLRLLGRGETLVRALEAVPQLPEDDVLLPIMVVHLVLKWRIIQKEASP